LRTRRTYTIGILVPDFRNPIYVQIIEGAEEAALACGYFVLLLDAAIHPRRHDLLPLLTEGRIDGLIVADAMLEDAFIAELSARLLPFVLVNRRTLGSAPFVVVDDTAGARRAVQHLISLGHQRIGYIAGPLYTETALARLQGVRQALQQAGLPLRPEAVLECGFRGEGVSEAARHLLKQRPAITAIATANILQAFALVKEASKVGYAVPEQLSVIGLHDTPWADLVQPGITTVRLPLLQLGKRAVELLIARLGGQAIQSEVVSQPPPLLIERESTAPPRS